MKIIMLIDSFVLGGAQRQFVNLAMTLKKMGDDVSICTYYPLQGTLSEEDTKQIDVTCFEKSFKYDLTPIFKLKNKIATEKPDVVVAFLATPSIYAELSRLAGHSTPVVVSERNGPGEHTHLLKEWVLVRLHTLAKYVVFNNHGHRNDLSAKYKSLQGKTRVIYNGVDERYFSNAKSWNTIIRKNTKATTKETPFKFCVVSARPIKRKGMFELIEAMSHLKHTCEIPYSVDWIGNCNESDVNVIQAKIELTRHGLESIWFWRGVNNELFNTYNTYDALLVPSRREGVSNALCEAMASGLPCIASDIVDHREVVLKSGSGILFEPQNAIELASCMKQYLEAEVSDLAHYGSQAAKFAAENFQIDRYAGQWRSLLQSAISD